MVSCITGASQQRLHLRPIQANDLLLMTALNINKTFHLYVCNSRNISHERLMKKDTEVPFIQRYHSSVSHLRTNRENIFKTKVCSSGQVFMI